MPFAKGQSGNPAGRKPGSGTKSHITELELRRLAQMEGQACIERLIELRDSAKTPANCVISAITILLDRGYGRLGTVQAPAPADAAVPSGVVEAPKPCKTAEEWQAQADAWMAFQARQKAGEPTKPVTPADPTKRH